MTNLFIFKLFNFYIKEENGENKSYKKLFNIGLWIFICYFFIYEFVFPWIGILMLHIQLSYEKLDQHSSNLDILF